MIINTAQNHAITNGVGTTESFTIKASASAFKVLSDGLYSNKIEAIVRELCANAVDSHIAAGKRDLPIEVKIPNIIDNVFYVKDYGIGLSYEQVLKLYTTYFESLKQDTNDLIGAFGLGSKSPFAYTDQFTVESIYGNEKSLYLCYLDNGLPKVSHISSVPTDEINGLTVSLTIASKDIAEFKKAINVFKYYNVFPNIICNFDYTISSSKYIPNSITLHNNSINNNINDTTTSYENIKLTPNDWIFSDSQCTVVQGGVSYPVDLKLLHERGLPTNIFNILNVNKSITFAVPLGTVQVAASRETLSYDNNTIQYLIDRLTNIISDIVNIINHNINLCNTLWEANILLNSYGPIHNILNSLILTTTLFKYKDTNISKQLSIILTSDTPNDVIEHTTIQQITYDRRIFIKELNNNKCLNIIPTDRIKVIIGSKIGSYRRCKAWLQKPPTPDISTIIYITGSDSSIATIIEKMGNPTYQHIDDVCKIENNNSKTGNKRKPCTFVRQITDSSILPVAHKNLDNELALYIVRNKQVSVIDSNTTEYYYLQLLKLIPDFNLKIYWVNESYVAKIPKMWMNLGDYIEHTRQVNNEFSELIRLCVLRYKYSTLCEVISKCAGMGSNMIDSISNNLNKINYHFAQAAHIYCTKRGVPIINQIPEYDNIVQRYPMLLAVSAVHSNNNSIIKDYINLMEKTHV